ncbi:hypothetical protein FGG08_002790 [Glutinoglossum americanum]|uniref:Glycosyl transferase CAP10 domain-containing protein n=1 Tax=Glutinoglossum americanum TaxID=1670608 RepID=A0A9P8IAY3_9PEZI|nr:hypothetical protein FGG08_002790 [Glutinoglossum americanum]
MSPKLRYFGFLAIASAILLSGFYLSRRTSITALSIDRSPTRPGSIHEPIAKPAEESIDHPAQRHPIEDLVEAADRDFSSQLSKETLDLKSAAAAYREKRGRHPPPSFDKWFEFAKSHKAVIVEDFWDQIYDDINPLWALPPNQMRRDARGHDQVIHIRSGNVTSEGDLPRVVAWCDLVRTIESYLPDMDIAVNSMGEPRLTVPWEEMNEYIRKEQAARKMPPLSEVISGFSDVARDADDATPEVINWNTSDSPARKVEVMTNFSGAPVMDLKYMDAHSYKGYVSNYTLSTSICHQPDLQGLHGALIEPVSIKTSTRLFPLFSESKLATNNELLLPAPIYWGNDPWFVAASEPGDPWGEKENRVIWRGPASGGENKFNNWRGFHRHRFVAMTNATQVRRAESWEESPLNWVRPPNNYSLNALNCNYLGDWLEKSADTGFVDLWCSPTQPEGQCNYTGDWFKTVPEIKMTDQYHNKLLVDIDGNSFSERYRAFLMSNSLPIKATLFREWHDSRLTAWKHFVPMDNRYVDLYGIMEYFLGYHNTSCDDSNLDAMAPHDNVAREIAVNGQEWARKVLRREDMQVYTLRLLLEYARVVDDRREMLGFVGDLAFSM